MKRLIVVLLLLVASAEARQRIFGYCENGNQTVSTGGQLSTTLVQRSYPSCIVTVFDGGTVNVSSIFSDNSGTIKANPFTASSDGYWFFYADDARYDVQLSGAGITTPFTRSDYLADDSSIVKLPYQSVSFSATPTFNTTTASTFAMTLTGNVTASTVSNSVTGQFITFLLCQDGTGGRTFAWPASFATPPTVVGTASACTNASFIYDGTTWRHLATSRSASLIGNNTFTGSNTFSQQITSSLATGTAPFAVTSTTPVDNLTVRRLDTSFVIATSNTTTHTITNPAAPRAITWPDPGGTASMPYLEKVQTWTAVQTFSAGLSSTGGTLTGATLSGATSVQSGASIQSPTFVSGIAGDGSGFKHKRVAGCATAASIGAVCDTTVTWGTSFADNAYTVVCQGDGLASGVPIVQGMQTKTASSIQVRTYALTAAVAQFSLINCIAVRD